MNWGRAEPLVLAGRTPRLLLLLLVLLTVRGRARAVGGTAFWGWRGGRERVRGRDGFGVLESRACAEVARVSVVHPDTSFPE